jgi:hypothetical protein
MARSKAVIWLLDVFYGVILGAAVVLTLCQNLSLGQQWKNDYAMGS